MTPLSRAPRRTLAALPLLVVTTLALGGCGSDTPAASPTLPSASSPSSTPTTTTAEPTDATSSSPGGTDRRDAQVVKVRKYGLSFELPRSWMTLDAKKALAGGQEAPIWKELADKMGTTPDRLVQMLSTSVQTLSVSGEGAHHGFLDNVNSVGQEDVLNDDAIKLQLASLGAKPGPFVHASSPAGDVTRVAYELPTKAGFTVRAVVVAVTVEGATVFITVSSSSAAAAAKIADQVQASLDLLPGHDPAA